MKFPISSAILLLSALSAPAAVVFSTNNEVGAGGVGSTFTPSYSVSSTDLINGMTPSASGGNFAATEISGGLPVLTDGTYGAITEPGGAADRTHLIFGLGGGAADTGTFVTYSLNIAANPLGFNISSIAVYGGWNDNGRDQQLYTVAYSMLGSSAFIDLPTVNFNPAVDANLQSATRTVLTNDSGDFIATGVDEIRFTFNSPAPENGYTGYTELDVIGSPSVPEPASLTFLAATGLLLAGKRRRSRR
ncbi:MAG: Immunoglobulin I-set domain protein [Verrucomicrobiales bacterium]|nr:Immunoglobulin I-set domain protein [Verrucomicrobiales bacterium]